MIDPNHDLPVGPRVKDTRDAIERGEICGHYVYTGPGNPYYQNERGEMRLVRPKLRGKAARKAAKKARQRARV